MIEDSLSCLFYVNILNFLLHLQIQIVSKMLTPNFFCYSNFRMWFYCVAYSKLSHIQIDRNIKSGMNIINMISYLIHI